MSKNIEKNEAAFPISIDYAVIEIDSSGKPIGCLGIRRTENECEQLAGDRPVRICPIHDSLFMATPTVKASCPWCKSRRTLALKPQEGGGYAVECFECLAKGPLFKHDTCGEGTDKVMAVWGWNRQGKGWVS